MYPPLFSQQAIQMLREPGFSLAPTITPQAQQLPPYDPTKREPGESSVEYDRRIQLYNMLLDQNVPSQTADVLARMRNNIDIWLDYGEKN